MTFTKASSMIFHVMWKIKYYIPTVGTRSPLVPFIQNLPTKGLKKLTTTFDLLENFGLEVGLSHIKKVTRTPLWELRIVGYNNIRIFYIVPQKGVFLLLHGLVKKNQKTSRHEIETALARLRDYYRGG